MATETPAYDRRAVVAWSVYDFANSAFNTLVTTFIYATYFTRAIAPDPITGTSQWGDAVTLSAVTVALLSPWMGALADRGGYRRRFLMLSTAVVVACTVGLYFPLPGQVLPALVLFVVANTAFELSYVFYNAFLPDLAPPDRIGRISGYGWALGYAGGLLCLVAALLLLVQPETPVFGFTRDAGQNIRAVNLLVAAWYAVFAVPLFLFVREPAASAAPGPRRTARAALAEVAATFREIRRYRQIFRLLVAHLVYNDGLITVFAFGGIYAATVFGFGEQDIIIFGIVLNVAAMLGAWAFGYLDDRIGGKRTILVSLAGLFVSALVAVLTTDRAVFWAAALGIGLLSGPNQAASRSLIGRFIPGGKQNEFYGFFALSGKFTAFMGPFLLARANALFQSQRAGLAVVLLFFGLGAALMLRLDEAEGIARARTPESPNPLPTS